MDKGCITIGSSGEINFTAVEKAKAEGIYKLHTVITALLEHTGASREIAEENACRIEHIITPELFDVLKKFVKKLAMANFCLT